MCYATIAAARLWSAAVTEELVGTLATVTNDWWGGGLHTWKSGSC